MMAFVFKKYKMDVVLNGKRAPFFTLIVVSVGTYCPFSAENGNFQKVEKLPAIP